ncbi:galactose oxidase [Thalassotalea sp. HSM 43]|uniref:Kelch repeat-containing protein n=1 Tax=Thalassotalea sp. HSM 43 TaxID=2552945 RepID=UPI001081D226|nr:galactose oxidase [Thalassotalea sp. HSM 43]QBY04084.1 galactose oxidase [Thalassotalea sp. HSM 43]
MLTFVANHFFKAIVMRLALLFTLFLPLVAQAAQPSVDVPALPEPVSNNAVAKVQTKQGEFIISFMGLAAGKTYQDVHNKVWAWQVGSDAWQAKTPVPSSLPLKGRLAAIAVGINDKAYIFGGYTVAKDHSEISSPDSFRYDVINDRYETIAPMPVPVDDSVALVYQQRYIYLISGWHNAGNVNLVQIYDTKTDSWQQGAPFLGEPVFGQAAGLVDNVMLVCDGVKVQANLLKRRSYAMATQCLKGSIDEKNPAKIDWQLVEHPTGQGRYRMAAIDVAGKIAFAGGSSNPYNYNGVGYNGEPSEPDAKLWLFEPSDNSWQVISTEHLTMDHRGLIKLNDQLLTIGGMTTNQQVLDKVTIWSDNTPLP